MRINQNLLIKGILPIAACCMITGCVDDKYDLKNIDTSSRINVNDLTIPLNLSEIKLENLVKLDDNENISLEKDGNGNEYYAIKKDGNIETSNFSVATVKVNPLNIQPTIIPVNVTVPVIPALPGVIDPINLPVIPLPETELRPYNFEMKNVDDALVALSNIKTKAPIEIKVVLDVPRQLIGNNNVISFKNIQLQIPTDLILENNDYSYDPKSGRLTIAELPVAANGTATFKINARGLDLGEKGKVKPDRTLGISGNVGVVSGDIAITLKDFSITSGKYDITARYYVSGFEIQSFSGDINYKMKEIEIAPISLSDLPDFLDDPKTNINIANPSITVSINNPVGQYGLEGKGIIVLTSIFKNGKEVVRPSDQFTIKGAHTDLSFGANTSGYTYVKFDGLGDILTNNDPNVPLGLPESVKVGIQDIVFAGKVTDFPLRDNLGKADGKYEFNAPLGFGKGTNIIYEATEDDLSGDDIDDLNINKISVKAKCTTNLPVKVKLTVNPIDKDGNVINVKENSEFIVDPMSDNAPVSLTIESANGKPINNFDGVRFRAEVSQQNSGSPYTDPIGPDLQIKLSDLKITVDGYFDYIDDEDK